jgi:hypothetical protein
MYCLSCGKSIPDESNFCLYCGTRIPDSTSRLTTKNTTPIAIDQAFIRVHGPTEVKKGNFLTFTKVGRGFRFGFSLLDATSEPTTSDGELIVAFRQPEAVSGYLDKNRILESSVREARSIKNNSYTLWYKKIEVKKDDFHWQDVASWWEGQSRLLLYAYTQLTPLLEVNEGKDVYLHLWFITPEGKCLYKTGAWTYWKP